MKFLAAALAVLMMHAMPIPAHAESLSFPPLKKVSVADDFFGEKIADPFRWLEQEHSPDVAAFISAENALTASWIPPDARDAYLKRLRQLIDYPRQSVPQHEGPYWITSRNTGLQQHAVLFRQKSLSGEANVLLDPNTFSKDGTVALSMTSFTRDGSLVAYGKSVGGSDDQTIYIRDVATAHDLADELKDMRFSSVAWAPDNSGFWYNRFPDPRSRTHCTVYWHRLGQPQSEDTPVFSLPRQPEIDLAPFVMETGDFLFIYQSLGTSEKNGLLMREISGKTEGSFRSLFPMDVAMFAPVALKGNTLYVYTDKDAPRRKLIAVDLSHPDESRWREILPQSDDLLNDVHMIGGRLIASCTRDVHSIVKVFEKDGRFVTEVPLPTTGSVSGVSGRQEDSEAFFLFNSYTYPGTIFRYTMADGKLTEYYRSKISFDPSGYQTQQVFFQSRDGTRVPMFVTSRKDLPRDGSHPALLYAYGGFNISIEPHFDPMIVPWLENGGVYAVANIRGGGEYGTSWHDDGMLGKKQNVFDDFISAAEKLVTDKITSPPKLAIEGGSNGGLLVAAVMLQRPDLFGAVVSQVPVTDMLRYQKFGTGRYWIPEYGDASASREAFAWLRAYSPLHNVRNTKYPPLLITTADGDDRVAPLHAFKFLATMQADASPGIYLLRHETGAGHGGGKPLEKVLEEQADIYSFLTRALGL